MKIGLDLDGTIGVAPKFFAWLSHREGAVIHVITARNEEFRDSTIRYLKKIGLRYDVLALTWDKAAYCRANGIEVFFDDLDMFLNHVGQETVAFKVRGPGNFDFAGRTWT